MLRIVLSFTVHENPPLLRVGQLENEYSTSAAEMILRETDGLRPALHSRLDHLLRTHAREVGGTRYSFGFAVVGPGVISAFLKNELHNTPTVYLVDSIAMDEEGAVTKLNAVRYTGWGIDRRMCDSDVEMHRIPSVYVQIGRETHIGRASGDLGVESENEG